MRTPLDGRKESLVLSDKAIIATDCSKYHRDRADPTSIRGSVLKTSPSWKALEIVDATNNSAIDSSKDILKSNEGEKVGRHSWTDHKPYSVASITTVTNASNASPHSKRSGRPSPENWRGSGGTMTSMSSPSKSVADEKTIIRAAERNASLGASGSSFTPNTYKDRKHRCPTKTTTNFATRASPGKQFTKSCDPWADNSTPWFGQTNSAAKTNTQKQTASDIGWCDIAPNVRHTEHPFIGDGDTWNINSNNEVWSHVLLKPNSGNSFPTSMAATMPETVTAVATTSFGLGSPEQPIFIFQEGDNEESFSSQNETFMANAPGSDDILECREQDLLHRARCKLEELQEQSRDRDILTRRTSLESNTAAEMRPSTTKKVLRLLGAANNGQAPNIIADAPGTRRTSIHKRTSIVTSISSGQLDVTPIRGKSTRKENGGNRDDISIDDSCNDFPSPRHAFVFDGVSPNGTADISNTNISMVFSDEFSDPFTPITNTNTEEFGCIEQDPKLNHEHGGKFTGRDNLRGKAVVVMPKESTQVERRPNTKFQIGTQSTKRREGEKRSGLTQTEQKAGAPCEVESRKQAKVIQTKAKKTKSSLASKGTHFSPLRYHDPGSDAFISLTASRPSATGLKQASQRRSVGVASKLIVRSSMSAKTSLLKPVVSLQSTATRAKPPRLTATAKVPPPPPPLDPPAIRGTSHIRSHTLAGSKLEPRTSVRISALSGTSPSRIAWKQKDVSDDIEVKASTKDGKPLRTQKVRKLVTSVGSDVERLRCILERSRLNQQSKSVRYVEPLESAFAVYDENKIIDPMQRAGLRLLSAAVVPIQSMIRRHLAIRRALILMWSGIVVQSLARRWLVLAYLKEQRHAATSIQGVFRVYIIRKQILLQHCSAMEIQRIVRGFLGTLSVYESIYQITVVQSVVRRRQAVIRATDRMVFVIQLQSIVRRFLRQKQLDKINEAALVVQKTWRAFSCRFSYQLELLDIIQVQSFWRRRQAKLKAGYLRCIKQHRAATMIQSHWRSFDCTMNFLQYLADILIVQDALRRWLVRKEQRKKTAIRVMKAARKIQKCWRGFVCYADFMFTISDIVIVQTVVRKRIAQRVFQQRRQGQINISTLTIQRYWRRFAVKTKFKIRLLEDQAATSIQSSWRRFWFQSIFIISLDSVIRIQSTFRTLAATKAFKHEIGSVLLIQVKYRAFVAKRIVRNAKAVIFLLQHAQGFRHEEESSANAIQRVLRGSQTRNAVKLYQSIRKVQAAWRCASIRSKYTAYISARKIQAIWRCKQAFGAYKVYYSALNLQKFWRRCLTRARLRRCRAADTIQRCWRDGQHRKVTREICRAIRLYGAAVNLQRIWRGLSSLKAHQTYRAATKVQKTWRGYSMYRVYNEFRAAQTIQGAFHSFTVRQKYVTYQSSIKIQTVYRQRRDRRRLLDLRALRLAAPFIGATELQKIWRGYVTREVNGHKYTRWVETLKIHNIAAEEIQRVWRGYLAKSRFRHAVGSVIQVQAFARCYLSSQHFVNTVDSLIVIQSLYRGCRARSECKQRRVIQLLVRSAQACSAEKNNAIAFDRNCRLQTKDDDEFVAEEHQRVKAAQTIQRFFLMVKAEVDRMVCRKRRRRKARRKYYLSKKIGEDLDNDILEKVWSTTINESALANEVAHRVRGYAGEECRKAKDRAIAGLSSVRPKNQFDLNRRGRDCQDALQRIYFSDAISKRDHRTNRALAAQCHTSAVRSLTCTVGCSSQPKFQDKISLFAAWPVNHRLPKSRMTLSSRDIDDDLNLETAFIDAEIQSAKARNEERCFRRSKRSNSYRSPVNELR
jgi:hypothetical protein